MNLELEKNEDKSYNVYFNTGKYLGKFQLDVDGEYYYIVSKTTQGSYWNSYALRLIADKLDELNREISINIDNDIIKDII
jgi:hypothetical protein